jgi:hypothetical protein
VLAGLVVFGALLVFLAREEPAFVPEPEFTLATETLGDTNRSERNETVLE